MKIYAQVMGNQIVNLIGGSEVGLPLPQEYLDENPHIKCIDITDVSPQPVVGQKYTVTPEFPQGFFTDEEGEQNG